MGDIDKHEIKPWQEKQISVASDAILDFRLRRERSVERFAVLDCKKLTL